MHLEVVKKALDLARHTQNRMGRDEAPDMPIRMAKKARNLDAARSELGNGLQVGFGQLRNPDNQDRRLQLFVGQLKEGCRCFPMIAGIMADFMQHAGADEKRGEHHKLQDRQRAGDAVEAVIGECHRNRANDDRGARSDNAQEIRTTGESPNRAVEANNKKNHGSRARRGNHVRQGIEETP